MLLNLRDVAGSCQNYDCKRGREWRHKLKHLGIILSQVCNSLHSFSLGGVLLKPSLFPSSPSNYPVVNPQCVKVLQFETHAIPNYSHPCQSFSATWSLEKTLLSYFLSENTPRAVVFLECSEWAYVLHKTTSGVSVNFLECQWIWEWSLNDISKL